MAELHLYAPGSTLVHGQLDTCCQTCGGFRSEHPNPPAVGTIFTLPNDVIPRVRTARWVVTSTAPGIVRYRIANDSRVGKRPITTSLEHWLEEAQVEETSHG